MTIIYFSLVENMTLIFFSVVGGGTLSSSPVVGLIYSPMQCCIQLAQGKLTLDKLTDDVLNLMHSNRPTGLHQGSGVSFAALDQDREQKPSADVVKMIQKLSERARYAQRCCNCVLVCFRIALVSCGTQREYIERMAGNRSPNFVLHVATISFMHMTAACNL